MAIQISIFNSGAKTFSDMSVGDYFIQDERLYCKTDEVYDRNELYNAFCVDTGELVGFDDDEGGITEVKDIDITVHL